MLRVLYFVRLYYSVRNKKVVYSTVLFNCLQNCTLKMKAFRKDTEEDPQLFQFSIQENKNQFKEDHFLSNTWFKIETSEI